MAKIAQLIEGNYNILDNIPVINQDLTASGFTPVANTYYRHTGATTDTFTQGVIYLYDTAYHKLGESGGGGTLNSYTFTTPKSNFVNLSNIRRIIHILTGAKKILEIVLLRSASPYASRLVPTNIKVSPPSTDNMYMSCEFTTMETNAIRNTFIEFGTNRSPRYSLKEKLFSNGSFTSSEITDATELEVSYLNDVEITK